MEIVSQNALLVTIEIKIIYVLNVMPHVKNVNKIQQNVLYVLQDLYFIQIQEHVLLNVLLEHILFRLLL